MTASSKSRAMAQALNADQQVIEARGIRQFRGMMRRLRVDVLRAVRRGESPDAIADRMKEAGEALGDAMTAAHLQGIKSAALRSLPPSVVEEEAIQFGTFDSVIAQIIRQFDLDPTEVDSLRRQYGLRAVSMTGEIGTTLEKVVRESVLRNIAGGATTREGAAAVRRAMESVLGTLDRPHLAETIYRTQVQSTFNAGRFRANQAPVIREQLWGYEYVTVGDDRVRPNHAELDGLRRPKEDPIWDTITPPNGFNCRCQIIEVYRDDPIASSAGSLDPVDVDGEVVVPEPDPGFEFNPGRVFA